MVEKFVVPPISELIGIFRQGDDEAETLTAIFQSALLTLRDRLPGVEQVELYRLIRSEPEPWISTGGVHADIDLLSHALASGQTRKNNHLLVIPLSHSYHVFALLALHFPPNEMPTIIQAYEQVAEVISLLLSEAIQKDLLRKLAVITQSLSEAKSLEDITRAIGKNFVYRGQFVSIHLIEEEREFPLQTIVSANRKETFSAIDLVELSNKELSPLLEALHEQPFIHIVDLASDPRIHPRMLKWLTSMKIKSFYMLPLLTDHDLVGLIVINDVIGKINPSAEEQLCYENIADQTVRIIQQYNLHASSNMELEITHKLLEASQELSNITHIEDIIPIVERHLAPDASRIRLEQGVYTNGNLADLILLSETTRNGSVNLANQYLSASLTQDALQNLMDFWRANEGRLLIFEDLESEAPFVLSNYYLKLGASSLVIMPIWIDGRQELDLTIIWQKSQKFDVSYRRSLNSLQENIRNAYQNLQALQQAQMGAESLGQQLGLLQTFNQLAQNLNRAQSEQELLDMVSQALVETIGVDRVGIAMTDLSQEMMEVLSDYPDQRTRGIEFPVHSALNQHLQQNKEPYLMVIKTDPLIDDQSRKNLLNLGIIKTLLIPIIDLTNEMIGSVGLDMIGKDRDFTPEQINISQSIVNQMAISLQNVRLLDDSTRQAQLMQQVARFAQSIQSEFTEKQIMEQGITTAAFMFPLSFTSILSYEDDILIERVRYEQGNLSTTSNLIDPKRMPYWDELRQNPITLIEHRTSEKAYDQAPALGSLLIAPLFQENTLQGLWVLGHENPTQYKETDRFIFQQLANQVTAAMRNAIVYDRNERLARNKSIVNELSSQLQQQTDIQHMLELTLQEIGKSMNARQGRIRIGLPQRKDHEENGQ